MSSTATIELERLVAPISEISGAGEDLREDSSPISAYHTVKSARAAARNTERSAAQNGEAADSKTEWRPILAQTTELLSERSKDLELTAWFIEASVRLHGFAGLRDGFRLTRALLESFWDDCYPKPEGSDLEARVAPLTGLNGQDADGTLIVPIRNVALTEGQSVGPFAYWQYSQAVSLAQIADADARDKRAASGAVTLEQIELASAETDPTFFAVQREHLDQCIEEYGKLCATLAERCGDQAPPSSNIKNELEACSLALTFASKDVLLTATEDEALSDAEHSTSNKANGHAGSAGLSGQPSNREDAFKTLLQLAAYFRRTEPHSPLSYAIEQIVRWGRLPLPDLLEELIAEEGARTNMFRLAGIRRSGQSDSGKSE